MSLLGDLVRLSPQLREDIRSHPATAYERMTTFGDPERLELDWEWKLFGPLFTAAGFSVNPFRSGVLFPEEPNGFARALDPPQVAEASARLDRTPFTALAPHLLGALVERDTVRVDYDYDSPTYGRPLPPERIVTPSFTDEELDSYRTRLTASYTDLTHFYRAATHNGECTVFWAA
ncbi:hypothetical protein Aab01nite_52970 [Paractinoplanes abujensis]|uniref:DUF1877 family protein n=1 Tax=Paractinoplanes abujensis TaxID=882441 RepID=A0A7W7CUH2_9ACTN|nr:DUF1877 family protein [Actinoplanes abujensis]MBB4693635.1 hypothetical protein [Actinoplanes abujensis]GID21707.1 hypothetical protein Aab01nite_52970 [Actinoplanes abujensis]